jgi:hypothetical protein
MTESQLDYLDGLAIRVLQGHDDAVAGLSTTAERIYVVLVANRFDLAPMGYTIVQAIDHLGPEDLAVLIQRWK